MLNNCCASILLKLAQTGRIAIFVACVFFFFTPVKISAQNCTVNADVDKTICATSTMSLIGQTNGSVSGATLWSQVGGPSVTIVSPNSLTTTVTDFLPGNVYRFRLSTTCEDGSLVYDEVNITVNPPSVSSAGPDVASCGGTNVITLAASGTGTWTVQGTNNGVTINSPTSPTSTVTLDRTKSGTTTLRWTVTNGVCTATDDVAVTNYGGVSPVNAGIDKTLGNCFSMTTTATMTASFGGGGFGGQAGLWSVISGPNIPTITTPTSNTTTVTNLIEGTYKLRWAVSGPCVNGTDDVLIIVPSPVGAVTTASASGTQTYCDTRTSATISGNLPTYTNETGVWTMTAKPTGAATPVITSPTSMVTSITGLGALGTYTFRWTITNSVTLCTTNKTVNIVYVPPVTAFNVGADQVLSCGATSATIPFTFTGGNRTEWRILSGPANPVYTSYPTSFSTSGISNANTSTSATIASLTTPGTYLFEFRRYIQYATNACSILTDQINIVVSATPSLSNAGSPQILACNIMSTALAGNIPTVGTGRWSQVSGPSIATLGDVNNPLSSVTGLTNGVYIFRWLISGGAGCGSSQGDVSVAVASAIPTAANAGPDQLVCYGTPVILAANPVMKAEVGTWTVAPSAGVVISDVNSPTAIVTGLAASTVYTFTWTITNVCGSTADNVIITSNTIVGPTQSDAGIDQCQSAGTTSITLAGNAPSVETGQWAQITGTPAVITDPGLRNSTVTGLSNGKYSFEWALSLNGCVVSRDTMDLTISAPVTTANAGADQSVCGSTVTLAGNTPTVGTGTWTQVSGLAGWTMDNEDSPACAISGLVDGTYIFRWSISNGTCTESTDDVKITVTTPPTTAIAGADQNLCGSNSATLAGNIPLVGIGIWTVVGSANNAPTFSNIKSPTSTVSGLVQGTYTLRWTISNGVGCPASFDDMVITVVPKAVASPNQNLCSVSSVELVGLPTGSTGTWTLLNGSTVTLTSTGTNTAIASGLVSGIYTFTYTITSGSCSSSANTVVTISAPSAVADAGPDQDLCRTGATLTITMAGNVLASPSVGKWARQSGPTGANGTITSTSSPTTTITGVSVPGIYYYTWTSTNGSCANSDLVKVTVSLPPTVAAAGADQSIVCGSVATMAANNPTVGVGSWTQTSGPNTAVITSPILYNTTITGLVAGTYTFRWTISSGPCTTSADEVSLTAYTSPTTADAGADQTLCNAATTTLAGNTITVGAGLWSQISGPNTATFANTASPTSGVNGMVPGTYVFQWTSTNTVCSTLDQVTINNNALPTISSATPSITGCLYSTLNLAGNMPTVGTGMWTQISGPAVTISSPASPTTTIIGAVAGSYSFRWTISNGNCTPSTSDEVLTVTDVPSMAVAGADQTGYSTCNQTSVTLAGNNPTTGTGQWSIVSGASGSFTNASLYNTTFSGVAGSTYTLRWTISNGGCTSTDDMVVKFNQLPTTANAGPDQTGSALCGLTTTTLAANTPTLGTGLWTIVSGTGGTISTPSSPTSSFTGVAGNTYTLRWTISNSPCTPSTDNVVVTFLRTPTASNAGLDQTLACGATSTTLAANAPTVGTGAWSVVSGSGGTFGNASSRTSSFSGVSGNIYILRWTISNGACTPSTDDVTISLLTIPTITGTTPASRCGSGTVTLGATASFGTINWYLVATGGTSQGTGTSFTTPVISATTTYYVDATYSGCTSASRTAVVATVNVLSTVTLPSNQTVCNGAATSAVSFSGTGTSYNWTNDNTSIGLAASGTGNISSFTAVNTGSTTKVATVTVTPTANGCIGTSQNFTITVNPIPTISVSPATQTVCSGSAVSITATNPNAVAGAAFTWTRSANANLSGMPLSGTGVPISGSLVSSSLGTSQSTVFTITVTANGCSSNTTSTVTIFDNIAPVITSPGNITVNNDEGLCAAVVNYTVTATDNCSYTLSQTAGLASGSAFPVGATTNTFVATDPSGNSSTVNFIVTVIDNQAPVFTSCPTDQSVITNTGDTYVQSGTSWNPAVTDNCSYNLAYALTGVTTGTGTGTLNAVAFNTGVTTVMWTATDASGNTNNTCTFTVTVAPQADVQVTKTCNTSPIVAGQQIQYTLAVLNNGPATAQGVVVSDAVNSSVIDSPQFSVNNGSSWNTWPGSFTIGSMVGGNSFNVLIRGTVKSDNTGDVSNTATVSTTTTDPVPANNTSTASSTGTSSADLAVTITRSPNPATAGALLTYTISVTNNGPSTALGVLLADVLPATIASPEYSTNGGSTWSSWVSPYSYGTLANGSSFTLLVRGTVDAALTQGSVIANTATVSGTTTDPVSGNNTASINTNVDATADLVITKTDDVDPVYAGNNVTYTITVTNNGPSNALAVAVNDVLPTNLTVVSTTPSIGSWTAPNWTVGNLANGASATMTVTAKVLASVPDGTVVSNMAVVSSSTNDPNTANNTTTQTTTVDVLADIWVNKWGPATITAGTKVTYYARSRNLGPSDALNVLTTEGLLSGLSNVEFSMTNGLTWITWMGSAVVSVYEAKLDTTVVIRGDLASNAPLGQIDSPSTTTSETLDPDLTNNTTTWSPTIIAAADLVLTKTCNTSPLTKNQPVQYTITVFNQGPSDASDVVLTDAIDPANIDTPEYSTDNGATWLAWGGSQNLGTIVSNVTKTVLIKGLVKLTAADVVTNTASVASAVSDPVIADNTMTINTPVDIEADLSIAKTGPATANAGETIEYSITVTNNSSSNNATNVIVSDLFDPLVFSNTQYSVDASTSWSSWVGSLNIGAVNMSSSYNLLIKGKVLSGITANVTNKASVGSDTPDATPANNTSATVTTTISKLANLSIVKTGPATVIAGNQIEYTLTYTNNGPSDAEAFVNDDVPSSIMDILGWSGSSYVGSITAGNTFFLKIKGTVSPDATGIISNTSTIAGLISGLIPGSVPGPVTDPVPANNSSTFNTTIISQADLSITNTASTNPVIAGNVLTYTIEVNNNGPSNAKEVTVTDAVAASLVNPQYSTDGGIIWNSWTGSYLYGGLNVGSNFGFQIRGTVNSGLAQGSSIANSATVSSTTTDPVSANNTAANAVGVNASADLAVVITGLPATVNAGEQITYTVTVTHNGTSDALNSVVNNVLPTGLTLVSATPSSGTWTSPDWSLGSLITGSSETLTIVAKVNSNVADGTIITNTATVSSTTTDPVLANNTSSVNNNITTLADMQVLSVCDTNPVIAGQKVQYTVTIANLGPSDARDMTGTDLISPLISNPMYSTDGGINWNAFTTSIGMESFPAGLTMTFLLIGDLNSDATGTLSNTAEAATITAESNYLNNTSTVNSPITTITDLAVTETVSNPFPAVGSNVVFTITVTNNGPSDGTGIELTDVIPTGYVYVSDDGGGNYVSSTGKWIIGSLTNNASATLMITASANATGVFANAVSVTGHETDSNMANNTANVSVSVIQANDDTGASINGYAGGTSFFNILANDRLDGSTALESDVLLTQISSDNAGVSLQGADIVVAAGTPAGNYTLTYQICGIVNTTNCDQATVSVPVTAAPISAANDAGLVDGAIGGVAIVNVLTNDLLNGVAVDISKVDLTVITPSTNSDIVLNTATGDITTTIGVPVPAGDYPITYRICEKINPTNCADAIATVTVIPPPIDAINDTGSSINGFSGGTSMINVLANDLFDNAPVDPAMVTVTTVSATHTGISLSGTDVVVALGTPAGNYSLTYRLCDNISPSNCDEATVSVPVTAAPISAIADAGSANGMSGGTAIPTVVTNDLLDNLAVDIAKVDITVTTPSADPGIVLNTTTGAVTVAQGTVAGSYPITYQICEILNPSNCSLAIATVTVTTAPIEANDDTGTGVNGYSGGTAFADVLTNDLLNGDPVVANDVDLTFVSSTNPKITLSGQSVVVASWTPAGRYQLVYSICEKLNPSNCDLATVDVYVEPATIFAIDDAGSDIVSNLGGTSFTNVLANDLGNGAPIIPSEVMLSFVSSTHPGISLVGTNVVVAAGTPGGDYTLVYQICGTLNPDNCEEATVTVKVIDYVPLAVADEYTTTEDLPVGGNVSPNDKPSTDGGNVWSLIGVNGGAAHGTVTMEADGTFNYVPTDNYNGTDVFNYQVCDVDGDCSPATATIMIDGVNDLPVVVEDLNTTLAGVSVNGDLSVNDTPSGDGGNVWSLLGINGGATLGTVTLNPDGAYLYTPLAGAWGTDSFMYQLCDADGDCVAATATIIIEYDYHELALIDDENSTLEDVPVNGDVSGNDTPLNNDITVWELDGAFGGALHGKVTMNPDGTYTYTPNADYFGTDVFTYKVCDANSVCKTAVVNITITSVNDLPVAVNDVASTPENISFQGNITGNDTPSGDGGNVWSLIGANGGATKGTVTLGTDHLYTYTPALNQYGTDVFNYLLCDYDGDCSPATVTVTIDEIDHAPVAAVDVFTGTEDMPVTGNVSDNDTPSLDGGNVWTMGVNAMHGTAVINSSGSFTYTPQANYNGPDEFVYRLCDADGDCTAQLVSLTITGVNDVPFAVDDVAHIPVNITLNGSVISNDSPSGDGGNVWSLAGANGGAAHGTVTMNANGTYAYTPVTAYTGTDVINYQLCDVDGDCSPAKVTITVNASGNAPFAVNDTNATDEDMPVSGNASTNDTPSADGGNIWTLVGVNGGALHGSIVLNTTGTYTYTPAANYYGTDVFTYQVCDADNDCSAASITITISSINEVPIAVDDVTSTPEDFPLTRGVRSNDTPSGDGGNVWSLDGINGGAAHGTVSMPTSALYTYIPNANYHGTDSFNYILCDVDGDCDVATVTITINPVDDAPIAANDNVNAMQNSTLNSNVADNDTPSGDGGNIWSLVGANGGAAHGTVTLNPNGDYSYVPVTNFFGSDSFVYQICDVDGDCSTATVYITVQQINSVPVAVNDVKTTNEDVAASGNVSSNDTPSADGGNVWTLVGPNGGAAHGTISMGADGSYTYTPTANYFGSDVVSYQVCDVNTDCSTANITITITSVNDLPVAVNDAASTPENVSFQGNITGNDIQSGDGGNVWSLVGLNGGATKGTVTLGAGNLYTYTPALNQYGTDVFNYQLCDYNGDCSSATVTIRINNINHAPTTVNDVFTGSEDTPFIGNVSTNDSPSLDGGNVWELRVNALHGTVTMNSDGSFTYTPVTNYNGVDEFIYRVCDADDDCAAGIVSLTISGVNDLPVAVDDIARTPVNVILNGSVAGNDTPSGDGGNVWSLVGANGGAAHGTVTMNANGTYAFTPTPAYTGTDVINYQLCDGDGDCSPAIVTITVNSSGNAPVAVNDTNAANEDTPVSGNASTNDTPSADGGNIWTLVGVNGGALHGTVVLNTTGMYIYTPAVNYHGTDVFVYQVCDADNDCSAATVTITIASINDLPVAEDDFVSTPEDVALFRGVMVNDTPSGDGGNVWSLDGVNGGATHGTVTMTTTGFFTYTPAANYHGTDSFNYRYCDVDGDCSVATVTIAISSVNDAPVAVNDNENVMENSTLNSSVPSNDTPSGDGGNVWALIGSNGGAAHGTVTMNSSGSYTYTPALNYSGTDAFYYNICDINGDCSAATVTITVTKVNHLPVAVNDVVSTSVNQSVSGNANGNDTPSVDGGNAWVLVGTNGGATHGIVTMTTSGTYSYSPATDYSGTDTFSYKLCDVDGDCSTATVTVTIKQTDDVPVAVDDTNTTTENVAVSGSVASNDKKSLDGGNVWTLAGTNGGASHGTVSMSSDGSYTYTPASGYNGTDVFSYQLCDVDNDCSRASVTISVGSVNNVPVAVDDSRSTSEDVPVSGFAASNDTPSGDGGNVWVSIEEPAHGAISFSANGKYTYIPNTNFFGVDSFIYQLCDVDGDCSTATVTITVRSVNDMPLTANDLFGTPEDTPVNGDVAANDKPSGDGTNVWGLVGPNGGATNGTVTIAPNGAFVYTPKTNFNGTEIFTYQLCDVDGDCSSSNVTIVVNSVNDLPVALSDDIQAQEDTPVLSDVTTNDTPSGDGGNGWKLFGANGGATHGTVVMETDGKYTYTPNTDYSGTDSFSYQLCDYDSDCSQASVTVTVIGVNDLPAAVSDLFKIVAGVEYRGSVAYNDTPSGDGGNVWGLPESAKRVTHGVLNFKTDGSFYYMPETGYVGTDDFTYSLCDVDQDCSTATAVIIIGGNNGSVPFAINDENKTNENTIVAGDASLNDTPSEDGGNQWTLLDSNGKTAHGSVVMDPDGKYIYTPAQNYSGSDVFTYQVCDDNGDCAIAIVTIEINKINHKPVAVNDIAKVNPGVNLEGNVSMNDTPSSDGANVWTLVSVNGGASHGSVSMNTSGTYTYTSDASFTDTDVFTYQVCDVDGDCSNATVSISLKKANDEPIAVNDVITTSEDILVNGSAVVNDTPSSDGGNTWSLVQANGSAVHGTVVMNPDGNYTYTPEPNYFGTDNFVYQVCDTDGDCSVATVTVTISGVNDLPVAMNDAASTPENVAIRRSVTVNDTSGGDGGYVWSVVGNNGGAAHGSVELSTDGKYTYTPDANYHGKDTFTYRLCDKDNDCSAATVTITVTSVNNKPVAVDDVARMSGNTTLHGSAVGNDTPSGDGGNVWSLPATGRTPAHGQVTMSVYGTYTYTPTAQFTGTDTFDYQLCDADGDCSTAKITLTIEDPGTTNNVPLAVSDVAHTTMDVAVPGDASQNDTPSLDGGNAWGLVGPDGGALHGAVEMDNKGAYAYTPKARYVGLDVFTYQVCDADGDCSATTVSVAIHPANSVPVAVDDTNSALEDTPVTGNVITNDTQSPNGINSSTLSGSNGGAAHGSVSLGIDGRYTYTPDANYTGTDRFIYQLCDQENNCSYATVTITIVPVNDLPVALDDEARGAVNTNIQGTVVGNDTPSGDGDNVWTLTQTNGGAVHGTVTMKANGIYLYTPATDFVGSDSFSYWLCDADGDCSTAIVAITIHSGNNVPIAVNDVYGTKEHISVSGNVSANDTPSADGGNTWSLVGINGGAVMGTITLKPDGSFTYDPDRDEGGTDVFIYQVCDADGDCSVATATIAISEGAEMRDAVDDEASTPENITLHGNVSINDMVVGDGDDDWALVGANGGAAHGTVSMNSNGTYTYIPTPHFSGTDVFNYILCDEGEGCSAAKVTITITPLSSLLMALDDSFSILKNTVCNGSVASNDIPVALGSNIWKLQGLTGDVKHGTVTLAADGTFIYTPATGFVGIDTFGYMLCNGQGQCEAATVTITVKEPEDPVVHNESIKVCSGLSASGSIFNGDSNPSGGTLYVGAVVQDPSYGIFSITASGLFTYTPNPDFIGTDHIIVSICNNSSLETGSVDDTITIVKAPEVILDAGSDVSLCSVSGHILSEASAKNYATLSWSTSGTGTFEGQGSLNATYLPSAADLLSEFVVLTLTGESSAGCGKVTDPVKLYFDKVTRADAGEDQEVCSDELVQLSTATAKNYKNLKWTTNGKGKLSNATTLTPVYSPSTAELGKIKFVLTADNASQCGNYTAVDSCYVTYFMGLSVKMMDPQTVFSKSKVTLTATGLDGSGQFTYQWTPLSLVTNAISGTTETLPLTNSTTFTVTVTDEETGCSAVRKVFITVEKNVDNVIKLYNTLSPNGDGINDVWWIDGIEYFPDNKVLIFNRWGDQIKELHNYDNNNIVWDGKNKHGKQVPDGTYYYVLTIINNNKSYTGWISVRNIGN